MDHSQWEGDTIRATWDGVPLDVKATKTPEMADSGHLCGPATRFMKLRMEKMIERFEYALPALLVLKIILNHSGISVYGTENIQENTQASNPDV